MQEIKLKLNILSSYPVYIKKCRVYLVFLVHLLSQKYYQIYAFLNLSWINRI